MSNFNRPRRPLDRRRQDHYGSQPPESAHPAPGRPTSRPSETHQGRVKWFSTEKGFGFVTLDDGSDVFLHSSVLARVGVSINPGDPVRVEVAQGLKGRQVTALEMGPAGPATAPQGKAPFRPRPRPDVRPAHDGDAPGLVRGVVKWWNQKKGFGFITPDTGTQDVFVHVATVTRAGLHLEQGMPVRVKVRQGPKGPQADEIALA
jgi:CspA family cold shock protein